MSPDLLFSVTNDMALIGWVMLAILPGRRWVPDVVTGRVIPIALALVYAAVVVATFFGAEGNFSSLDGVASLFSNRWLLLAGWVHYLAFDLLIGTWEARDARERGLPHLLLVPCLFLTLMFGPAGWLLYMLIRRVRPESRAPVAAGAIG
jgi:hypothetical protein